MNTSETGNNINIKISGGSHTPYIEGMLRGMEKGLEVDLSSLKEFLGRRKADGSLSTGRLEEDEPVLISGITDGVTDGKPIVIRFENKNANPADYEKFKTVPRPSHADYVSAVKYGAAFSGGGHFSGRMTLPLCALGFIAKCALEKNGIFIGSHILSVGKVKDKNFDPVNLSKKDFPKGGFPVLSLPVGLKMKNKIMQAKYAYDSIGGTVECAVIGLPAGVGEPNFNGLENAISSYIFAIPAAKGIQFGNGFKATLLKGSENNDPFTYSASGKVVTKTNNSGGINGGISNGMPLIFNVAFKPVPSIGKTQKSVNLETGKDCKILISGRHDPSVLPRITPVVESCAALAIYDLYRDYLCKEDKDLARLRSKLDKIDLQILSLFEKRQVIIKEVKEIKRENNIPVTDKEREEEILGFVKDNINPEFKESGQVLFNALFECAKAEEKK